jgi:hypothetical protein
MMQRPTATGVIAAAFLANVMLFSACERPPKRGTPEEVEYERRERSEEYERDREELKRDREEQQRDREERRRDENRVETKDITVENFDAIDFRGTAEMQINVGLPASLQISGGARVLNSVKARVSGDKLDIDVGKGRYWFSDNGKLRIVINVPTLKELESNGAGEVDITGLAGGELKLKLAGAHNLKANGKLDTLKLDLEGAGNADFRDTPTVDADIEVSGAGNVDVHVTGTLKGEVNGVGAIRYSGNPQKVESKLHGLGAITER